MTGSSPLVSSAGTLLAFDGVKKSYGEEDVLEGVSFCMGGGEALAVIGPSGCGKSTLLYLAAGLREPDSGKILLADSARTAFVLQDFGLFPWKTVRDNISLPLVLAGVPSGETRRRCASIMEELGLSGLEERWPAELSGGQRQRVALGRALVRTPSLLLLDEPFSSLDAFTREAMQDLVLRLHRRHGFSYILVTHSVAEALYLGERILPLAFGRALPIMENPCFSERPDGGGTAYGRMNTLLRSALAGDHPAGEGRA
ncbi:MAG: ATP-binding cassette domain-containing protein [Mailhella sp.]|nr:ATP-binding cassette domain-containing protein [Mailhella sp.]